MNRARIVCSLAIVMAAFASYPSLFASPRNAAGEQNKESFGIAKAAIAPQTLPLKFGNPKRYGTGVESQSSVAVGDLNGDGRPDLAVAGYVDASTVGILLGNGDGTFQLATTYNVGGDGTIGTAVAIGDVNGDGHPDLIETNQYATEFSVDGSVNVLLGNGDGTFQAPVSYDSGGPAAMSVAVADVNGDGHPDIVVVNTGSVGVLMNDGTGLFQTAVLYGTGGGLADSVAIGDFDGNGKPDIVVANECQTSNNCNPTIGTLGVLLNKGSGTFKAPVVYSAGGYEYAVAVAVADMDGDGKLDLVVSNWCSSNPCPGSGASVLLGKGDGTFAAPVTYNSSNAIGGPIAVGDINGDGHPDVIANGVVTLSVLLGNGDGTLEAPVILRTQIQQPMAFAIADLNVDGRADLIALDRFAEVGVLLNTLKEPSSIVVASSANPALVNQTVTFSATVSSDSPVPDRSAITFLSHTVAIGTGTTKSGIATLSTSFAEAKSYPIQASYAGDPFHGKSVGKLTGGEVVTLYPTNTTLVSSPNPSTSGQLVTLTATVSSSAPGGPTGKVTFKNGTKSMGSVTLSGGTATLTTTKLPVGTLTISAEYMGDTQSAKSTGTTTQTVN